MKLDRAIRVLLAAVVLLAFVVAVGAVIFLTESALNVWDRLVEGPRFLLYGYVGVMLALLVAVIWLIWRLVIRRKIRPAPAPTADKLSREDIEQRLRDAEASGVDVGDARAELQELAARQETGSVHLCFFGEISTGKSSLIKALVPEADQNNSEALIQKAQLEKALSLTSPMKLYTDSTATIIDPMRKTTRSVVSMGMLERLSIARFSGPLPLSQSVLVVLPYIISLIAITVVCFAVSYSIFMRQEIRSL